MEEKKRATEAARTNQNKDSISMRNIQQVRRLFLSGAKYTAKQINHIIGFNDARKVISVLRTKERWNIQDYRLSDGSKVYWLVQDDKQLSLFSTGINSVE